MSSNAITIPGAQIEARALGRRASSVADHGRPQTAGNSLYSLGSVVSRDRRSRGAHHSHSADAFAQHLCFAGSLQPHVHHARDDHDFLRGHASPVWICELSCPIDDWCARHGISAPECLQFLAFVSGRASSLFQLSGGKRPVRRGKRTGCGLVGVRAFRRTSLLARP